MANKEKFIELLKSTKREGIDNVIKMLEESDFFTAPASTKYHGSFDGGLCVHSLNVYQQMMYLKKIEVHMFKQLEEKLKDESIILTSLLHDVCKIGMYKKTKKWKKDENNKWVEYEAYDYNNNPFPAGHGERSVITLLKCGLSLTDDEILAIRWHMGKFDVSDYSLKTFDEAADQTPLVSILVSADYLASRITENINGK